MKALLYGQESKSIEALIQSLGFEIVTENPDVVISYGGDGTLLSSEREYPGIPKLPIRNSQFCNKCAKHADAHLLSQLLQNKLQLKEYKKLHTSVYGKDLYALNDFVIRNQHQIHSIRFRVTAGDHSTKFYIGDGIVVATFFGSTGYFKSVTGESFNQGIGIAFNNTTEKESPVYLNEDKSVIFQLVRGKTNLSFDNNPDVFNISEGIEVTFNLSQQAAKIYEDTSLRCPNCLILPRR